MRGIKQFLSPETPEQTYQYLDEYSDKLLVLAGGTHLGLQKTSQSDVIVDLKKSGFDYIKEDADNIIIGATVRAVDIINNPLLKSYANGILSLAASKIGTSLTRNMVTIGANTFGVLPWSNLLPALLVVNAKVEISSSKGSRIISLEELLAGQPRKIVAKNEILSSIILSKSYQKVPTSYQTVALAENDHDMVIVATEMSLEKGICKDVRVVLGVAVNPCKCLDNVCNHLKGKKVNADLINESANMSVEGLDLIKDFRTTDRYRLDSIKVLVRRTLERLS